jgi:transposase-like protein
MDTYASPVRTDSLGRRGGPRRRRPLEEKRKIVEETLEPGASVAIVARRHELNANVIFGWRRLYRAGRLGEAGLAAEANLIPVKASAVREVGALSDLNNISVRIADVAARLAVLRDRLRDELRSSTLP